MDECADMKPNKCDICGKTFFHASYIKRHKFVDTEEKPYQCDICDKHFSHTGDMKRLTYRRETI